MKRFGEGARFALLLASVCASPLMLASPAMAQDAVTEEEELVVTARRTAESIQDVPGSVSAFSENRLEELQATDATGLQGAIPNVNIVQGRGSSNATNIYIRGVGQPDALQTFDPAVGFYVDDVYYSRIRGTQLEVYDIERVEVLRGPQGTLYGRNTIGGAFKIVTRRPGQDPHGLFQVTLGDYGQIETRVAGSTPLSDNLAIGGALFGAGRDGYVTDPVTGEDYNDREAFGGRVQIAWDPANNVMIDWSADIADENNSLVVGQAQTTLTNLFGVPLLPISNPPPEFDYQTRTTPGLPNSTQMTHWGTSLRASWEVSPSLTLRSITAYRDLSYDDYVDIDATQLEIGDVYVGVRQNQTSQEFQALYDDGPWNIVGGVYYMRENVGSHQEAYADDLMTGVVILGIPLSSFTRTVDDDLQLTTWAAFVNGTYAINDRLNISAGIRYTDETKEYDRSTSTFYSSPLFNATFAFSIEESWNDVSPMLSIDYDLNDNIMLYARAARGFKSGGFNGRANNPGEQAPYDPEISTSYEAGARTDWLDGRLRANFTVFHTIFEDFQARVSGTVIDPGTGAPSPELTVINAGELEMNGAEIELNFNPVDALRLDAQIGYLDAKYNEFLDNNFPGGDRSGQTPAFAPEWTARFGAAYTIDLSNEGSLVLAGSARYRSEMALAVDNHPTLFSGDYWLYDASLTWNVNDIFSIALQGRNLSDEVYKTEGQEFSSVGGIRTVYFGAPQTTSLVFTARY